MSIASAAADVGAQIVTYAPIVITGASLASSALPKPTPGTWYAVFRGFIDVLAINFGNAKNAK